MIRPPGATMAGSPHGECHGRADVPPDRRAPDDNEAMFFKLPADGRVPVFEVWRVGFDAGGNRLRLTVTAYPADRNRLRFNVGVVPPANTPNP